MRISDLFQETFLALLANKARSGLTVLGIVIGIGSVIAMISIGQGAQGSIQSSIQSLGSNLILVTPGMQRGVGNQVSQGRGSAQTLTLEDASAISQNIFNISGVAPDLSGRYQVTAKGTNTNTSIDGVTPFYSSVRNIEIADGVFITDQNVANLSRVAILGSAVSEDLFGTDVSPIGQTIRIKNINFTVVGLTKSKGGTGFGSQDDMIFIPLTTAQQFLAGSQRVSTISVQATSQAVMSQVQEDITFLLLERHHISDSALADFSILNQSDIVAAASSVTNTFTILLGSVAAISLLVGGIGIMNMMLTTVTERTREIGLRKAIGAKGGDINLQFLTEAIMLTFVGGIVGVIFGWLISWGVYQFANIATKVSLTSILLAFGVSALIGIIFGYYPARRASKLNPIEALRYE
ncbi:MAG: ABC transporter permease [Patescibacteria group bacterium]|nr:ABC transporter permease [Patescibacteria group bacterium]MDD5121660.1 ABC transporter permease [Patescibacteria group bacterium]MDD5222320.1 ABC transporter permease [Patescibacteria group bacterium]MDD5396176.1 ABC transporter permease [Patescibacteria group bacterium]